MLRNYGDIEKKIETLIEEMANIPKKRIREYGGHYPIINKIFTVEM